MSFACCLPIVECVYCLACARWAWKKFLYTAGRESENWGLATASEFEPVPRLCRYILSVYEDDLRNPLWAPPGGYGVDLDWIVLRRSYEDTQGKVAPYMIYLDHGSEEIVVAIRGLNLAKESDYLVLLDDKLGQAEFDGGFVHNGLLKSAQWVEETDSKVLGELIGRYPNYTLTFAGHSLGAGVVTLLAMLAVKNRAQFGNVERRRIRCFAIAPARCVSLNLAVRYADIINSVVLQIKTEPSVERGSSHFPGQYNNFSKRGFFGRGPYTTRISIGSILVILPLFSSLGLFSYAIFESIMTCVAVYLDDFLPRTTVGQENAFKSLFCFPCVLCIMCLKDTCTMEEKKLKDPRRLYAPGRLYHIIARKPFSSTKISPVVRTAIPVDGRFEHIVLSCNMTSDHAIICILTEAQRALDTMLERDHALDIPTQQRMERQASLAKEHREEHRAALQRAVALDVPQAYSPSSYGTFHELEEGENSGKS